MKVCYILASSNKPKNMNQELRRNNDLRPVLFRKGSEAAEELEAILVDVTYEQPWHDAFDKCIAHYMATGLMNYKLAQEVYYRFQDMRTYTAYDECRRYRRAIELIIERTKEAFPEMSPEGQLDY
tara:strand:- start:417 stop:791 length:375 start_codon:yes stop_codon:yes gene_type:complete